MGESLNLPTILIAALIAAVFIAIVVKSIRDKKAGKHGCGCGCEGCGSCNACHPDEK